MLFFRICTCLPWHLKSSLNNHPDDPHGARQPGGAVRPGGAGGQDDDRPDGGPRQDIRAGGPGEAREPKGNVKLCSYYDVINCQLRTKASLPKSHIFWPFTTFSTGQWSTEACLGQSFGLTIRQKLRPNPLRPKFPRFGKYRSFGKSPKLR